MRTQRVLALTLVALSCACGGATNGAPAVVLLPPPSASAAAAGPSASAAPSGPQLPAGYVEAQVLGVFQTESGGVVALGVPESDRVLPIFVGGTEALSIELRHDQKHYERPLTHDLLDAVMHELGGQLVNVQVDELRDNTFVGSIVVRHAGRTKSLDARPSDAIALAIGARVPIYVASRVLDAASVSRAEVPGLGASRP